MHLPSLGHRYTYFEASRQGLHTSRVPCFPPDASAVALEGDSLHNENKNNKKNKRREGKDCCTPYQFWVCWVYPTTTIGETTDCMIRVSTRLGVACGSGLAETDG